MLTAEQHYNHAEAIHTAFQNLTHLVDTLDKVYSPEEAAFAAGEAYGTLAALERLSEHMVKLSRLDNGQDQAPQATQEELKKYIPGGLKIYSEPLKIDLRGLDFTIKVVESGGDKE